MYVLITLMQHYVNSKRNRFQKEINATRDIKKGKIPEITPNLNLTSCISTE